MRSEAHCEGRKEERKDGKMEEWNRAAFIVTAIQSFE